MKPIHNRHLYTGDSNYLFHDRKYHPQGGRFAAQVFHNHIDELADNGIDTYLLNPNAQVAWYPSKVIPRVTDGYRRGDRNFARAQGAISGLVGAAMERYLDKQVEYLNHYLDLEEAGVDWLAETIQACQRRRISPWVSIRMNDVHASGDPQGSYLACPLYKHAANRLSGRWPNPQHGAWDYFAGLNYALPQVREYMLAQIREVVEDYAFEGLELDWLRNPLCCEPPASAESIEMMTAFHAAVRRLTDARARQTGKPYYLGLRLPGSLGQMKSIGVDVPAIVAAGLVDFVGFSAFWQSTWDMPHDQLRTELGDRVMIYGGIEAEPNGLHGYDPESKTRGIRLLSSNAAALRANAAGKLALGADGLEQFNFFCGDSDVFAQHSGADYSALRGLADLEFLRGKPKHYLLQAMFADCWIAPFELPEQLPVVLRPHWRRAFRLPMCAEPRTTRRTLTIQVVIEKRASSPDLGVACNGSWPTFVAEPTPALLFPFGPWTHHVPEHQAFNFRLDAGTIRDGWNEIVVCYGRHLRPATPPRPDEELCVLGLEAGVQ